MPEHAEIEAVMQALEKIRDRAKYLSEPAWTLEGCALVGKQIYELAAEAGEALDRVRDARDDNNGRCRTCGDWIGRDGCERCARSRQGEDHEAGIEAATRVLHGYVWHERLSDVTRATVAAYLSRVPPSRGGTVAVEQPEPDALGGQNADGG